MSRRILILLFTAVLVSGCTSTIPENSTDTSRPEKTAPTEKQPSGNNTIFYTDSGFQPSTLTVQAGEIVTWIDRSSSDMWVASDRHPSHTQYSGTSLSEHCQNGDPNSAVFDQCSIGERFSFTFEKTGTWRYHNHERANHGGTIVVE